MGAEPQAHDGRARRILLALIAIVHLPLLGFGLIYDDAWTLRSNGFLRPEHFELALLATPEAAARHVPDAFRPTLVVFDMLSYRVLGLRPWAHHALSIVLHVGVCALLARGLERLGASRALTLAATAVFGLLAVHAEAVAVVSFREDLLAALLGLGALLASLRAAEGLEGEGRAWPPSLGWAALSAGLMALACGAKLSAAPLAALPVLLSPHLGLTPWPGCRKLRGTALVVVMVALSLGVAAAVAQTALVHGGLSPYAAADNPRIYATRVGLGPVLAASAQIHLAYLGQILAPLGALAPAPEYVDRGARWLAPATLAALVVIVGSLLGALAVLAKSARASAAPPSLAARTVALATLAWWLACVPTSNLAGLPNMRADRFLYLPSLPLCVALAAALLAIGHRVAPWLRDDKDKAKAELAAEPSPDMSPWLPLAVFVLVQASTGLAATRAYVSNSTLWHHAVRRAPDSARAHALLGIERLAVGRHAEGRLAPGVAEAAEADCLRAKRLDDQYELPELCLAILASAREDWSLAYEHHARAVELSIDRNDRSLAAMAQLALDLPSEWLARHPELPGASAGDRQHLALTHIERGLSAYPYSPELQFAAGRVYHRIGQPDRALDHYRRARSLRPERWETVAAGVELALDLGDAAAAHRTWWAESKLLSRADAATRTRLARRLAEARKQPDFSLLHSLLSPGVFPDGP